MNSSEAFIRAALYEQCAKSPILKHVDIDNADTEMLRDLINKSNTLAIRKIPILLSKFLTRTGVQFVVTKWPKMHDYVRPELIRIRIEDDEMNYLLKNESTAQLNIVVIVVKNIVMSMLGTSIETFASELYNMNENMDSYANANAGEIFNTKSFANDDIQSGSSRREVPKTKIGNIRVVRAEESSENNKLNIPPPPRTFTSTFDSPPLTPKSNNDQQHNHHRHNNINTDNDNDDDDDDNDDDDDDDGDDEDVENVNDNDDDEMRSNNLQSRQRESSLVNDKTKLKRLRRTSINSQYSTSNSINGHHSRRRQRSRQSSVGSSINSISHSDYRKKLLIDETIEELKTNDDAFEKKTNSNLNASQNQTILANIQTSFDDTAVFLDELMQMSKQPKGMETSSTLTQPISSPTLDSTVKTTTAKSEPINIIENVLIKPKDSINSNGSAVITTIDEDGYGEHAASTDNDGHDDDDDDANTAVAIPNINKIDTTIKEYVIEDDNDDDDEAENIHDDEDDDNDSDNTTLVNNIVDNIFPSDSSTLKVVNKKSTPLTNNLIKYGAQQLNRTTLNSNAPKFDDIVASLGETINLDDDDDDDEDGDNNNSASGNNGGNHITSNGNSNNIPAKTSIKRSHNSRNVNDVDDMVSIPSHQKYSKHDATAKINDAYFF